MKMLAEEKKTGTIEMLLTKAVTDREVVSKFAGCLVGVALVYPALYISVACWARWTGATLTGLGLLLMSAAYIAIGLFASSVTNNQIVASACPLIIFPFVV
jgi:ABC-2 type transport system permease protein